MRYYAIVIGGANSTVYPTIGGAIVAGAQWSTIINGMNNPSAQQIEFQIEEYVANAPSENSILTIYGIPFDQIRSSGSLVGATISIYGGMYQKSFPLSAEQSAHSGLLMQGIIFKCWGNWIGTEMSIGFAFIPSGIVSAAAQGGGEGGGGGGGISGGGGGGGGGTPSAQMIRGVGPRSLTTRPYARGSAPRVMPGATAGADLSQRIQLIPAEVGSSFTTGSNPGAANSQIGGMNVSAFGAGNMNPLAAPINMIHNMPPNTPLSSSIQQTLSQAFPNANLNINISSGIQLGYQDAGMYQTLEQYAKYIQQLSHSVLGSNQYLGVNITAYDNTIHVWDGIHTWADGVIAWWDLIGQPTWIEPQTIHIKCVLRADIHVGMGVTLPDTPMWTNVQSNAVLGGIPDQKLNLSFVGRFKVVRVYHVGDFRNPDGANWSTNIHAIIDWASIPTFTSLQIAEQLGIPAVNIDPFQRTPTPQGTARDARTMLRETPKRRTRTVYG